MGRLSLGHYLVGVEGLALYRSYFAGNRQQAERIVGDLARLVTHPDQPPMSLEMDVPELDVQAGYASWAGTYDTAPNPLVRVEEPIVHALIDSLTPRDALDAACGTGRHTRYLHKLGHRVVGVDASAAMLERARLLLPDVDFHRGDLHHLPLDSQSVDLAVCALALSHFDNLGPPIAELARVLRPGGCLLLSDFHPIMIALGGTAFFIGTNGAGHVRSFFHSHSAYLKAFKDVGLDVQQCIEPAFGEADIALMAAGMMDMAADAFHTAFAGLPGALIWLLSRSTP